MLNAFLLIIGSVLIGALTWRAIGRRAGVVAGALYAFSPAVFATHLNLLAEPLYLVLATLSLGLMATRNPTAAGLAAAAATLTRYAGLPLILTGAIVMRGQDRLWFLAASITPYALWILRNELTAGQANGRQLRWHPPEWEVIETMLRIARDLVVTDGRLASVTDVATRRPWSDPADRHAVAALVFALVRADEERPAPDHRRGPHLRRSLLRVPPAHRDGVRRRRLPVHVRLLTPLVPPIVLVLAWLTQQSPIAAVALFICIFGIATVHGGQDGFALRIRLLGQPCPTRRASTTWRCLPARCAPIGPTAVTYFTGRSPDRLPRDVDQNALDVNPNYERELRDLAAATRAGKTSLVILNTVFLENAPSRTPLAESAPYEGLCHPATTIITICTARR